MASTPLQYPPAPPPPPESPTDSFSSGPWQRWLGGLPEALGRLLVGGGAAAYRDQTAARAFGTTYTNGGVAQLALSVTVNLPVAAATASLLVQGAQVALFSGAGGSSHTVTLQAIVPKGSSFRVEVTGGATLSLWSEL